MSVLRVRQVAVNLMHHTIDHANHTWYNMAVCDCLGKTACCIELTRVYTPHNFVEEEEKEEFN